MGRKSLKVSYGLINRPDEQILTVVVPGVNPMVVPSDHPNFEKVMHTLVRAEGDQVDPDFDHLVALCNDVEGTLVADYKRQVGQMADLIPEEIFQFDPGS